MEIFIATVMVAIVSMSSIIGWLIQDRKYLINENKTMKKTIVDMMDMIDSYEKIKASVIEMMDLIEQLKK